MDCKCLKKLQEKLSKFKGKKQKETFTNDDDDKNIFHQIEEENESKNTYHNFSFTSKEKITNNTEISENRNTHHFSFEQNENTNENTINENEQQHYHKNTTNDFINDNFKFSGSAFNQYHHSKKHTINSTINFNMNDLYINNNLKREIRPAIVNLIRNAESEIIFIAYRFTDLYLISEFEQFLQKKSSNKVYIALDITRKDECDNDYTIDTISEFNELSKKYPSFLSIRTIDTP
ncbi:MAG: hypothetical protein KatS3mg096_842 [Candidatus Parcubacteria bacterium]|nr:MAG: hypothetical protein KatS3mg096_842 [Candidatus Parcubacteria bacterium]